MTMDPTAIHEAAHAVAHVVLGYPVEECTLKSNVPGKSGHTRGDVLPESLRGSGNWASRQLSDEEARRVRDETVILLIGEIAEARLCGTDNAPDFDCARNSDEQEAFGRIVTMRPSDYEGQNQLLGELLEAAQALANGHWTQINDVAAELAAQETLTGEQVQAAMASSR